MFASYEKPLYGLTQSPRAWFGRFGSVLQSFGMTHDDIVITRDDHRGIRDLKSHLFQHFQTKDLGQLKYFLGIEVAQWYCHLPKEICPRHPKRHWDAKL